MLVIKCTIQARFICLLETFIQIEIFKVALLIPLLEVYAKTSLINCIKNPKIGVFFRNPTQDKPYSFSNTANNVGQLKQALINKQPPDSHKYRYTYCRKKTQFITFLVAGSSLPL